MELLKPVLNGLKEIKEDLVDSYYTLFTSISSPDFFDKTMEKLIKDLHLDNEIAKGILKGIMEILPVASPAAGLLGPVVLGVVDHYSKKNDGKITKDDVNKIIEEVKQTTKEIKTISPEELNSILEGHEELLTDIKQIQTELNKLDLILEEVKRNGFKNLREEIEETTDEKRIEEDRKNFYNNVLVASYNPYKYDFDIIREDTRDFELKLTSDETNGILLLGESGSGKTTILKRIAYDFMLKGWNVYVKIKYDFDVEKLIESIKKIEGKSLIVVDEALTSGEQRLRDLIENVWKQKNKNIKILMAERNDKWADKNGNYVIGKVELERKKIELYNLKLSENDVKKYFKKLTPKFNRLDIEKFVEKFKKESLGKPGEFIMLQIYLNWYVTTDKNTNYKEALEDKCEAIKRSLEEMEEKVFYRVASIGTCNGKYSKHLIEKILNINPIETDDLLNSLEKKGHIKRIDGDQNIITYHPYICEAFLENQGIYEREFLEEFIENYDGNDVDNLFIIGTSSGSNLLTMKFLEKAIEIKEDFYDAHLQLGKLYEELLPIGAAENEYKRAAEIKEDDAEAHYHLGNLYADMKRYAEAEKEYKRAIEIKEDFAGAHDGLGWLYKDIEEFERAEKEFKRAIEIEEDFTGAHDGLLLLYEDMGRFEEAEKEYHEALKHHSILAIWRSIFPDKNMKRYMKLKKNIKGQLR